ncbi:alpha/beta fold hydrolase, partial [Croceitalea marina]
NLVGVPDTGRASQASDSQHEVVHFIYDMNTDCYTCPQEHKLKSNKSWYGARNRFKQSKAFKGCKSKSPCAATNQNGKIVRQSEFRLYIQANIKRVVQDAHICKKRYVLAMCLFVLIAVNAFCQEIDDNRFSYTRSEPLLDIPEETKSEIEWRILKVPENWGRTEGRHIKLAVAKIKSNSNNKNTLSTIFIQGGPGGSSIYGVRGWLNHPLREVSDIILMDLRGTGFSVPNLCPDLGKDILQILAKNQSKKDDENEKISTVLSCRDSLLKEGIDLMAYNSFSIANDFHALKSAMGIKNWNVYGVSYGTFTAQIYAKLFPEDTKSVILDSPISDIGDYFDLNTSNYVNSLKLLFDECEKNIECNTKYPNLEEVYYKTIEKLENEPITVQVDTSVIPSGEFTYNVEDFKIAIQQSLYQRYLVEILPMLIYEFNLGNKATLGNLVAAFSGALGLDYGVYYCTTCSEVINKNSLEEYKEDAKKEIRLKGGLSFYSSDYGVCNQWNKIFKADSTKIKLELKRDSFQNIPTLLFSGGFDPITPPKNAEEIATRLKNENIVNMPYHGHGTSFTDTGKNLLKEFVANNFVNVYEDELNDHISFITDIEPHGGVSQFASALGQFDLIKLIPLIIAILTIILTMISLFSSIRSESRRRKILTLFYGLSGIFSIVFLIGLVLAIKQTAGINFYILAIGLPNKYSILFYLPYISFFLFLFTFFIYIAYYKETKSKTLLFSGLFSFLIYHLYLFNWQLIF